MGTNLWVMIYKKSNVSVKTLCINFKLKLRLHWDKNHFMNHFKTLLSLWVKY